MSRQFITLALFSLTLCGAAASHATEVILRNRVEAKGSVVLLGDIAEIKSADAALRDQLAATPLIPSPVAGTPQYLRLAEIRDLVASRGIEVRGIRFGGTAVVSVSPEPVASVAPAAGAGPGAAAKPAAPQQPALRTEAEVQLTAEQLSTAVRRHLYQQTGHDLWNVRVEADSKLVGIVEQAGDSIRFTGGEPPWVGRQKLTLHANDKPVAMVFVKVDRLEMTVFALQPINRGDLVRRTDVELRPYLGALPAQAATTLEAVIGHEAVQGIRPDSMIQTNQLRSPVVVRRNERVSVRARAAGVSVRTYAIAQQDGGIGDLVMVQSVASKERYAARVVGARELEIFTAGTSATEIASNPASAR
ncbi:flagellar basal body P-ring formation chaperone FlgA [Lacipirellula sp.]|uniref:flagellar basal body P-ring formation chaperone FlgA n=1 Tax=Lacipirellula sp. TaxID=2691419 RepID=UPI003D0BBE27